MSLTERLDNFQRRHPIVGFPIGVIYKFGEDQGPYLAALITYYGFLSLFPLLLLLTSVLGFVLDGRPELQQQILDSTLSQFPVIGDQIADPQGIRGSIGAIIVGGLVALYGAIGIAQALQNAMNVTWSVPRQPPTESHPGPPAQSALHRRGGDRRTDADRRAYHDAVSSQQFKGFQSVKVHYEDDGQRATARRALARSPEPDETDEQVG